MSDDKQFPTGQAWDDERIDMEFDRRVWRQTKPNGGEAQRLCYEIRNDLTAQLAELQLEYDGLVNLAKHRFRQTMTLVGQRDAARERVDALIGELQSTQSVLDGWLGEANKRYDRIAELEAAEQATQKLLGGALHYPSWDYANAHEEMRAVRLAERIIERVKTLEAERDLYKAQAGMLEDNGRMAAWRMVNAEERVREQESIAGQLERVLEMQRNRTKELEQEAATAETAQGHLFAVIADKERGLVELAEQVTELRVQLAQQPAIRYEPVSPGFEIACEGETTWRLYTSEGDIGVVDSADREREHYVYARPHGLYLCRKVGGDSHE